MKKNIVFSVLFGLLATACSKSDDTTPALAGPVSFEITATTSSRASFYSEETNLQVTNVTVYAFKYDNTNYVYETSFDIPNWTSGLSFARYTIPEANKLTTGSYKFLAVGRNSTSDGYSITALTATTKYEDMAATITSPGLESDIYSGNIAAEVTTEGARVVITMKRAVAGVLGYFVNVPEVIGSTTVRYLRLGMSTANRTVNLVDKTGSDAATTLPYNVINIDLSGQTVENGIYKGVNINGITKLDFTQLAGTFVIPVTGATFTLGLYDAVGNSLKTWTVNLNNTSPISLVANNLYSLGKKVKAGSTNGGTPLDPSDDDTPIDLMVDQSLALTISPNWEPINYLTIQ